MYCTIVGHQTGLHIVPRGQVIIDNYSHHVIGGPRAATIQVISSDLDDLYPLLATLMADVNIYNEAHEWRWGGFVEEVVIEIGTLIIGISLTNVANRIRVTYTAHNIDANGNDQSTQEYTLWASDSESINAYGAIESVLTFGDSTEVAAELYRDSILDMASMPQPVMEVTGSQGGGSKPIATLKCRGYWDTLRRRYYAAPMLTYGITTGQPQTLKKLGNGEALEVPYKGQYAQRLAEQINVPSGSALAAATVVVQKVGNPTGLLRCELITAPDPIFPDNYTVVATSTIDLAHLPDDMEPSEEGGEDPNPADPIAVTFNFSNVVIPTADAVVIALSRLGATTDASNYINVAFSASGEGVRGLQQLNSDSSWGLSGGHLQYQLTLTRETTALIAQRIGSHDPGNGAVGDYAPFIEGVFIEQNSGVYASPYEDGQSRLQDVLLNLLNLGSTTSARLVASVNKDRILMVSPEPLWSNDPAYRYDPLTHTISTPQGTIIPRDTCPVGIWAEVTGLPVAYFQNANGRATNRIFIEDAEYNAVSDQLTIRSRGVDSIWS